jgi:hypothetical protein
MFLSDHPRVNKTPYLWGEPENVLMEDKNVFRVVEGDNFTLKCASSVYNNTQYPEWYKYTGIVNSSTG